MAKNKRDPIPDRIRNKVWIEAAGRCEFRGCNVHLWYNDITGKITPFGELAHVIGASRKGPRGNWNSPNLQTDPSNLMLLCKKCHKEIDYGNNIAEYPAAILFEMKKEHEERINFLLDTPRDKTSVLKFSCPIKNNPIVINNESIYNAVLPKYPDSLPAYWHSIEIDSFDYSDAHWQYVMSIIDKEFEKIDKKIQNAEINNLSVFGIAPIPLLVYFGFKFNDKLPADIFHARANNLPEKRFNWVDSDKNENTQYTVETIRKTKSKKVLLLLALSDYLEQDKYESIIDNKNFNIYKLSIKSPNPKYLKSKLDLNTYKYEFRNLLNTIQKDCGKDCEIHLLTAIPACIAIETGRIILSTKDPAILLYEYLNGNPQSVITINKK